MHSSMIPYRAAYATNISPVGRGNFVEKNHLYSLQLN